jgi:hypothetical protein
MRTTTWFLSATPPPWRAWWEAMGARLAAWGDGAHHHRLGSWEAVRRNPR